MTRFTPNGLNDYLGTEERRRLAEQRPGALLHQRARATAALHLVEAGDNDAFAGRGAGTPAGSTCHSATARSGSSRTRSTPDLDRGQHDQLGRGHQLRRILNRPERRFVARCREPGPRAPRIAIRSADRRRSVGLPGLKVTSRSASTGNPPSCRTPLPDRRSSTEIHRGHSAAGSPALDRLLCRPCPCPSPACSASSSSRSPRIRQPPCKSTLPSSSFGISVFGGGATPRSGRIRPDCSPATGHPRRWRRSRRGGCD